MNYEKGDIVLAPIVFPDNEKKTTRLLVLVNKNEAVSLYEGLNITTQESQAKYNGTLQIKKSEENKLDRDSYIKPGIVFELNDETIVHKIGKAEDKYLKTITSSLEKMSKLGLITRQPISSIKEHKSVDTSKQNDDFEKD